MAERRQDSPATDTQVKVVDRRRFRSDGEPVGEGAPADPALHPGEASGPGEPGQEASRPGNRPGSEQAEPATAGDERDAKLAAQQARIDELMRAYAALVEDNKAFRQRQEREKARVIEAERASIAQALLEAADELERALAAVSSDVRGKPMESLVEGVRLSLATLHKRIAELGAERLQLTGQPFDPRLAEAVDTVPVADADQEGCVVQEILPGYRIGEKVLRPARVRVGRLVRA